MSDDKPVEKPVEVKPQETAQNNKPQEGPTEIRPVELNESFAKKSGDQGVFFNPAVGINTPDPFASQDVTPPQPAQTIAPTPPPAETPTPAPQASSGGGDDSGE